MALLVCCYHNIYDAPLLALPAAACVAAAHDSWRPLSVAARGLVLACLLIPLVNVLWTSGFQQLVERVAVGDRVDATTWWRFRSLAAATNGLALGIAWVALLLTTWNLKTDCR